MDLTCPTCHGSMRTYERNGVHLDQCTDCRGIFLDRGELERLVDAEHAWHTAPGASVPRSSPQPQPARYERDDDRPDFRSDYRHRRRRKSFLEELFD
jgi:Zn-finger nucleic acid-binding protein